MKTTHRLLSAALAVSLGTTAIVPRAHAGLIGTEQLAAFHSPPDPHPVPSPASGRGSDARASLLATVARDDVRHALAERGVPLGQLRERIAALSDAEVTHLAQQIDNAPAGAGDVIGYAVFVFVLLLVTDILGFTKIFPFTRAVR